MSAWQLTDTGSCCSALRLPPTNAHEMHTKCRLQLTGGASGGVHVTDASNASRTNLLDLASCQWHTPFLELFGLTRGMMPRVVSNAEVVGHVKAGPLAGVPISGVYTYVLQA